VSTKAARRAFHERAGRALADPALQRIIAEGQDYVQTHLEPARAQAWWPAALEEIGRVRSETLAHLDDYVAQFASNVEAAGGHVFFAGDAGEARRHVTELAVQRGVKTVVKTKSMVTEEIALNGALEARGVEVWETDLGELIIQMAGEKPFHILGPAIHKSLEDVCELFSRSAGRQLPADPQALVRYARETLRERFLTAEMGITGANFGVAATGSVVLVTNEGNGRMVTTMPRAHVVVMGVERLVPTFPDLEAILKVLPQAGACMRATAYVTAVTGPRKTGERDGPEELHVVLVDNGRSRILGGRYAEILKCIRCGACVDVCPAYRKIGGHTYDSVYSGPIGAVLSPLLFGLERYAELPYACSMCGACSEVCSARIPLADQLRSLREDVVAEKLGARSTGVGFAAFAAVAKRRRIWSALEQAALPLVAWAAARGEWSSIPGPLGAWTRSKALPRPEARSFRAQWRNKDRR